MNKPRRVASVRRTPSLRFAGGGSMSADVEATRAASPVIICGTGGSGTRVAARIIRRAGCFLGCSLNKAGDSLHVADFLDRRINRYLSRDNWIEGILREHDVASSSNSEFAPMIQEFEKTIARHRMGMDDEGSPWGWKEPRSIFVLPFLHQRYPDMTMIHMVRDGRDMALSANQNQLEKHGRYVLGRYGELPLFLGSMVLWARVNRAAAVYGERYLGQGYLRVRFEDLCSEPVRSVGEMLRFLDGAPASLERLQAAVAEVEVPSTIGRWRTRSAAEVFALGQVGAKALRRFGYL